MEGGGGVKTGELTRTVDKIQMGHFGAPLAVTLCDVKQKAAVRPGEIATIMRLH